MHFARVNDIVLHYRLNAAPAGKPLLVFVNSLGTDFRTWDGVIAALGDVCSTLCYDQRGHGLSSAPEGPYRLDDLVGDLAALLDHLNLKDVIVCGLSIGGLVTQGLALARPELARALILSNTGARLGTSEFWQKRIEQVQAPGLPAIADMVAKLWFSKAFSENAPDEFQIYRNMLARQDPVGYAGAVAVLRDSDLRDRGAEIGVPVLGIAADGDVPTPPAVVEELMAPIPNGRIEVMKNAGHLPNIEFPDAYSALLRGFIEEVEG